MAAECTRRPRKRLTDTERRNIIRALRGSENKPLRQLEMQFGRNRSVLSELRKTALPHEPETVREHRCPGCGAKITTSRCLRCSLQK